VLSAESGYLAYLMVKDCSLVSGHGSGGLRIQGVLE
jgi:hypothetical protein